MSEAALDRVPCIYFTLSEDGTILEVNEKLCTSLKLRDELLTGKKADMIFSLSTRIFHQTHLYPLLKMQGYVEEIYISLKKSDGDELPVIVNAERVTAGNGSVYHYAGIVVQNRKKFEDDLIAAKKAAEYALRENTDLLRAKSELQRRTEELDEKLQEIEKHNEELRQFNRVITHDMQEPIRKLSILSNMLLEEEEDLQRSSLTTRIQKVTTQMRSVISGLQQYVWMNEKMLRIVEVDLNAVVDVAAGQVKKEFPDVDIKISKRALMNINADVEQMKIVFYQTLKNAVQFRKIQNEASIFISAGILQLNKFRSIEGKYKFVDFVRIEIRDEGKGFNPNFKEQAFELFKRLHEESGSGVGLALCKKIISKHNGTIGLESESGKGSILTIELPLHYEDVEQSSTVTNPLINV